MWCIPTPQPLTFLVLSFCKLSVGDSCCCYDGYRRFFTCWRYVVSPISFSKLALKTKHPPVPSFFAGKLFLLYICHGRMKTEIKPVIKSVYCNLLRDVNTMQWNEVQVFVWIKIGFRAELTTIYQAQSHNQLNVNRLK